MASPDDGGGKDEIKDHFYAREGLYKLMLHAEYCRPTRGAYSVPDKTTVRVSFLPSLGPDFVEKIAFSISRELYVYNFLGLRKAPDLTKPLDKRSYKQTAPTCHDFNPAGVTKTCIPLVIGFTLGQLQLTNPLNKDGKLFNDDRSIDRGKVTCVRWVPDSTTIFLASFTSGNMYVFNVELPSSPVPPTYQLYKHGDGFAVFNCKSRLARNPVFKWQIGEGLINDLKFSPCGQYLAVVGQDGYLRIFDYIDMNLIGFMRSYFGGLLCVAWSPDGQYLATGGEDDLLNVFSFQDKRVICRGQGHRSWLSAVAFDPFTSSARDCDMDDLSGSEDTLHKHYQADGPYRASTRSNTSYSSKTSVDSQAPASLSYRIGSVGHDAYLCLWDLTDEVLSAPFGGRQRTSTLLSNSVPSFLNNTSPTASNHVGNSTSQSKDAQKADGYNIYATTPKSHSVSSTSSSLLNKFATLDIGGQKTKEHKRNFSIGSKSSEKLPQLKSKLIDDAAKYLGTPVCPRLHEVPLIEPMVNKKISSERLTSIVFKEDCFVTANQDALIQTWARPNKLTLTHHCYARESRGMYGYDNALVPGTSL